MTHKEQEAINKIIQNSLDLLVEAKEALVEAKKAHEKFKKEVEWEISCLKKR